MTRRFFELALAGGGIRLPLLLFCFAGAPILAGIAAYRKTCMAGFSSRRRGNACDELVLVYRCVFGSTLVQIVNALSRALDTAFVYTSSSTLPSRP